VPSSRWKTPEANRQTVENDDLMKFSTTLKACPAQTAQRRRMAPDCHRVCQRFAAPVPDSHRKDEKFCEIPIGIDLMHDFINFQPTYRPSSNTPG
jgi:hypothetical protein